MSFLEMLDVLNEQLISADEEPVAFDSDCREGICGMCGLMINGEAHGPEVTTTCQLHMRSFTDGETITIEPWRADPFPVLKDLASTAARSTGSSPAGGYVSVNTGAAPDAHATPVPKENADRAFDVATCIGCGACVAACPNGSASLFLGAKITHLGELPQGQAERWTRVVDMVAAARRRGLRRLHQHRRVHRGLPQGDPARRDLPAQPRPENGADQGPPRGVPNSGTNPTAGGGCGPAGVSSGHDSPLRSAGGSRTVGCGASERQIVTARGGTDGES